MTMRRRSRIAEARVFLSWQDYQEALQRAIAPLGAEQLAARPLAGRRTPGEIAEHIVFGRALHITRALEAAGGASTVGDWEPEALRAEVAKLAPYLTWSAPGEPARTAAEIGQGLEATWQSLQGWLLRGTSEEVLREAEGELLQSLWGLLDHDLPHAGQLSLLLRAMGLAGVEI